jgi:uncharacterized SAM-binding protein YcdF (DUF218 family)
MERRRFRLAVVNSHAEQYFAPLYAYLSGDQDIEVTAVYCSDSSLRGGMDPGFGQPVTWNVDLLAGYRSIFLGRRARDRTPRGFFSLVCPEIWRELRTGGYDAVWLHGSAYAAYVLACVGCRMIRQRVSECYLILGGMIEAATMYNLASKILPLFLDPLALAILLLVCALLVRKRWPGVFQGIYATGVLLLIFLGCPTVSEWLTSSLEDQYPDEGAANYPATQAIVVLGGTINMPSELHHASGIIDPSDRLLAALRLYHAGKAPLVILSGGYDPLMGKVPEQSEADQMRLLLEEWGIPASAILVEGGSINTRENALFSHRLLVPRGIGRIILVTSALHMPRAAAAFRKVGFDVVAAPADFRTGWRESSAIFNWITEAGALAESGRVMHEWLGVWVYRLRGWA